MSISNLNGRLLEYVIVSNLKNKLGDECTLTQNSINSNLRDINKLHEVDKELLNHFKKYSPLISNWIIENFSERPVTIDRLGDGSGVKGDVTDIRLTSNVSTLNISIKNNNVSIKHQRPGTTPIHIGYNKKDTITEDFSIKYKKINKKFYLESLKKSPNVELYREVEESKNIYLYKPICRLVNEFLNGNKDRGDIYQRFLIGNVDFKQIVLWKKKIEIKSFDEIPNSPKMVVELNGNSYLKVDFNNGIILMMRLHTASSRISETGSLKFDTKIDKMVIPTKTINF